VAELKGLLDSAKRKIGGLLGDFPAGFNSGAVAGIAGYPGDIAYMLDTAGRAITGQDTQPAAQDFPGTTDYIAAKAGYPIPGSFSGQLGAAVGGMLTPGPGDLAKFAPVLSAIPFWHGSPHKYDAVDLSKIGTGEGAQAYGHGYYGADTKSVAEGYAKALAEANPHGSWREGEVQFEIRPADMGGTDFEIVKWAGNKSGDAEYGGVIGKGFKSDADATKHLVDSGAVSKDYASKWDELSESTLISESQKNLYRGEYRWPDPAKEAATPLTGEDLLQWDRPLSEQPESVRKALLNPGPSKSLGDVGAGNSDNASYLLESSAAAAKSGGGGNVPLDAVMSNRMGGMLDNGKVANPVVGLVPVDVVDVLTSGKLSPNGALDSNAMNLDLTPSNGGNSVPFGVNAAGSPVGGITRPSFAENAGVGGDVIGVPKNTLAALRAGDLDKRSGHEIYRAIADELGSDKAASDYLTNGNVLGIRYLDGMSRDGGKGTYNIVMFDEKGIKLLERNGSPIEDFAARRAGKAKPYREATGQRTLQDVVSELEQRGITVDAAQSGNNPDLVTLSRIVVPQEQRGQGVGTQAMQDLIGYADEQGKTIALSPSADFGASSVDRLKDFYKRFGFVDNKGKGRDFEISESMYRRGGK
jgi:GNAT superfamily N-acetyltransferase